MNKNKNQEYSVQSDIAIKTKTYLKIPSKLPRQKFKTKVTHNWKGYTFKNSPKLNFDNSLSVTPTQHYCIEKWNIRRLIALSNLLLDIYETQNLSKEEKAWFDLNYKKVTLILNSFTNVFLSYKYIYVLMCYKTIVPDLHIGRLYHTRIYGLNSFPRELRGLLFNNGEYKDFDIKNAHPVLMLEYALSHMKGYSPIILRTYVENRERLLNEVAQLENITRDEAKTLFLQLLNYTQDDVKKKKIKTSIYLKFHKECHHIRNHIYDNIYKTDSPMFKYYKRKKETLTMSLEKKKVSVQSLYLQTKETDYVLEFISFLREKVRYLLTNNKLDNSQNFSSITLDRDVCIDSTDFYITCIPFFDGLYIGSEDPVFLKDISILVTEYNENILKKRGSFVRFEEKPIKPEMKRLCLKRFNHYCNVLHYLETLSNQELTKLLDLAQLQISFNNTNNFEEMVVTSREFRRTVFKYLIDTSEKYKLPLNQTFIQQLKTIVTNKVNKEDFLPEDNFKDNSEDTDIF